MEAELKLGGRKPIPDIAFHIMTKGRFAVLATSLPSEDAQGKQTFCGVVVSNPDQAIPGAFVVGFYDTKWDLSEFAQAPLGTQVVLIDK